jgi:predicted O-methyltransferase YrrM
MENNSTLPIKHPWREILHRLNDPALVADTTIRTMTKVWDMVSPSKFSHLYRKIHTHTMCSNARLRSLYHGVRYIVDHNISGDLVECGCAQGGSAALMALTLAQHKAHRGLWLFDTFEGLPAPTAGDPDFEIAELFTGTCVGTVEEVRCLFHRLGVDDDVHLVKGLFQNTLPTAKIGQIALLHIDGDWYESVKVCLENLYDSVAVGGIIQFDDYGYWKGARKAVDEFFNKRKTKVNLRRLDYSGRLFTKSY